MDGFLPQCPRFHKGLGVVLLEFLILLYCPKYNKRRASDDPVLQRKAAVQMQSRLLNDAAVAPLFPPRIHPESNQSCQWLHSGAGYEHLLRVATKAVSKLALRVSKFELVCPS